MSKRKTPTPDEKPIIDGYYHVDGHINVSATTKCDVCHKVTTLFVLCFHSRRMFKSYIRPNLNHTHTCFDCAKVCTGCNAYICTSSSCKYVCNMCGDNTCFTCINNCKKCVSYQNFDQCKKVYCKSCILKDYKCSRSCNLCGTFNNLDTCIECSKPLCKSEKCSGYCPEGCGLRCRGSQSCWHHCWGC
jgi:hypothetical protein